MPAARRFSAAAAKGKPLEYHIQKFFHRAAPLVQAAAGMLTYDPHFLRALGVTLRWILLTTPIFLGAGYGAGAFITSFPIDSMIKTWTEATLPSDWKEIRARWAATGPLRRLEYVAVLLISADLDELIGLSDTLQVMLRGRLVARLRGVPAVVHTVHGFPVHDYMPRLKRHLLRAALLAVVLTAIYYANYVNGWITADDLDFYN